MVNHGKTDCVARRGITRTVVLALTVLVAIAGTPASSTAQADETQQTDPLLRRWVGHHRNRPIFFDFFGDSMLVVDDIHVLGFAFTWDSIIAYGDTSFAVSYRFSYDRLLITTESGTVFTMAPQDIMARPISAPGGSRMPTRWISETSLGTVEVQMREGGWARWRLIPGGSWQSGEWDRSARDIKFAWVSRDGEVQDTTLWTGVYDAPDAMIFEETVPESGITIFRRTMR